MLTDIFANRYQSVIIWEEFGENERKLLVQGFRIVSEQLFPYWVRGEESKMSNQSGCQSMTN